MKNNFIAHSLATFFRDLKNIEEILQPNSDEDIFHLSGQVTDITLGCGGLTFCIQ
jgi:hypothetical protein